MATKLGKVVTYHVELPHIKLLDPSVKWSCEVTSPLALDQTW